MSVDTKINALPFEAENSSNLFTKRMRSLRFFLLILCAVLLFGTAIFFAQRACFGHKVDLKVQEEAEKPKEEPKTPTEETIEKLPQTEEKKPETEEKKPEVEEKKPEPEEKKPEAEEKKPETGEKRPEAEEKKPETLLTNIEGSLYLKSFFKDMVCTMGGTPIYSVSCCGKFFLPESKNEHAGCIILDAQKNSGDKEYTYRTRITIENNLIGLSENTGLPQPGNKCFDLTSYPGHEVCLDFTLMALDNNLADGNDYNTCSLMVFGVKDLTTRHNPPEVEEIVGKSQTLPCDTKKDAILKESSNKFATILKLYLRAKKEDTTKVVDKVKLANFDYLRPPYEGTIYFKSAFQNMKCELLADPLNANIISLSCCGTFPSKVPNKGDHKGCMLVKMMKDINDKNIVYNINFIVDNITISVGDYEGMPLPGKSCFPSNVLQGQQICADLQYLPTDEHLSGEEGYATCKLMVFSSKENVAKDSSIVVSSATRNLQDVPCNTEKSIILTNAGDNSAILRVTVEPFTDSKMQAPEKEPNDQNVHQLVNKDPLDISTHLNDLSKEANSKENTTGTQPMTVEEHMLQDQKTMLEKAKAFFSTFNTSVSNFFSRSKKNSEA